MVQGCRDGSGELDLVGLEAVRVVSIFTRNRQSLRGVERTTYLYFDWPSWPGSLVPAILPIIGLRCLLQWHGPTVHTLPPSSASVLPSISTLTTKSPLIFKLFENMAAHPRIIYALLLPMRFLIGYDRSLIPSQFSPMFCATTCALPSRSSWSAGSSS